MVYLRPKHLRNAGRFIGQNFQRDGEGSDLRKIIPFHRGGVILYHKFKSFLLYTLYFCKVLFGCEDVLLIGS